MKLHKHSAITLIFSILTLTAIPCFADENLFKEAITLQRSGDYDEAINAYKSYLTRPIEKDTMTDDQLVMYTDALVQLMNTFQSKGEPEACISALQNVAVITCLNVEVAHLFH